MQHGPIPVKEINHGASSVCLHVANDADGSARDRRDSCGEIKTRLLTWVTQLGGGEGEAKEKEKKEGNKTVSAKATPPRQDIHAGI